MTKRWIGPMLLAAALVGAGVLGGCCSLGLKSCATTDQLTFAADANLNSCSGEQKSYPVAVRLYYLRQAARFESAEFQDLWSDAGKELADDIVGPAIDLTLTPGSTTPQSLTRPAEAAYLGIVANFCSLEGGVWRRVIPLEKGLRATVRLKDVNLFVE